MLSESTISQSSEWSGPISGRRALKSYRKQAQILSSAETVESTAGASSPNVPIKGNHEMDSKSSEELAYSQFPVDSADLRMLEKILLSSVAKKRSLCSRDRSDVVLKTFFRTLRKFFYYKFDASMSFRKIKRRVSYDNNYVELVQEFVAKELPQEDVNRLGLENLADYLAALINPKEMKEISSLLGSGKTPEEGSKLARAAGKVPKQIP